MVNVVANKKPKPKFSSEAVFQDCANCEKKRTEKKRGHVHIIMDVKDEFYGNCKLFMYLGQTTFYSETDNDCL